MRLSSKRSINAIAVFVAASFGLSSNVSAIAFDLGSGSNSYQAPPAVHNAGVPINIGGHIRLIAPGSNVSAAEYAAVQQVLHTGVQSLDISGAGAAVAGRFAVNQLPASVLDSLAIPKGVTVIQDFGKSAGRLVLPGSLTNVGSFFAVSTNANVTTADLAASSIYNGVNGLLTSVLPSHGLPGYADAIANLNLSLTASNAIVNRGTISSAGALNIAGTSVSIDNMGGQLTANGAINIGNGGTKDVTVTGGDLLSRAVNFQAANSVVVHVGQVSGLVNVTASELTFRASTANLQLGKICLSGDPVIYNQSGDVTLSSASALTTGGAPLTVAASQNIQVSDATTISTAGGTVKMTAGALFNTFDSNGDPIITGASATGGKIDLIGPPGITSFSTGSGSVYLLAYVGGNADSGAITLPTLTSSAPISIIAPNKVTISGAVTTGDNISINTNFLDNEGQITGKNVTVASTAGHDLQIDGNTGGAHSGFGTFTASGILTWVATPAASGTSDNSVILMQGSHQNLTAGQSNIIANGLGANARVEVQAHALIHTHTAITVYSQHVLQPTAVGSEEVGIDGSPFKWITPTGRGVLSSSGDLKLNTNIIAPGQNIAILAGGNVTAAPGVSLIDLSNAKGQSGSLNVVAGFRVSDDGNITNRIYTVDIPSPSGGSVLLPNVSVKTANSFTGPSDQNADSIAGNVTVVAHAGDTNGGVVLLKDVTAKGTSFDARGGNVLLIGQGGVKVGIIDTSAVYASSVSILGAEPKMFNGPLTIQNGNVTSGTIFTGTPSAGQGAAIDVGKINASSLFARAGNVTLASDSSITVHGDITAVGQRSLQHGTAAAAGGSVNISSLTDNVSVKGSIDVSGAKKLGELTADPNGGANAGDISISSPANILITGNLKAAGGTTVGVEHAGNGGHISITSSDVLGNGMRGGTVQINGYVDLHGGVGKPGVLFNAGQPNDGNGGNGGLLSIDAGQVVIKGSAAGYSIDARKGTTSHTGATAGNPGSVTIDTYAVQSMPRNFDLLSSKSTEVALPGGKLTVGAANPLTGFSGIYNGVAGGIIADTTANALKSGTFVTGSLSTAPQVTITVHQFAGVPQFDQIAEFRSTNFGQSYSQMSATYAPGTLITPARAVALMQVSRGVQQTLGVDNTSGAAINLNPSNLAVPGSVVNLDQAQMRQQFSSFVLDTISGNGGVQLQVAGARPTLDLSVSGSTRVNGSINFTTPQSVSTVSFGSKLGTVAAAVIGPSGAVAADATSSVVLTFNGTAYRNVGTLAAGKLLFLNNSPALSIENAGSLNATYGSVSINNEGIVPKLSIRSVGATWNHDIAGVSSQLPLASGVAALRTLPVSNSRAIDLTVQAADQHFGPFGASLTPVNVVLGGTLNADNVNITAVSTTSNHVVVPTSIQFLNANATTTNFAVTSAGHVFFENTKVTANGGNIQILAQNYIDGDNLGTGNSFVANGVGTAAQPVGGGISFSIGTKATSDLATLLKSKTPSGSVSALGGSGSGAGTGDVFYDNLSSPAHPTGVLSVKGSTPIDLTFSGGTDATIKQRGGAILFSSPTSSDPGEFIHFNGVYLETSGLTPVAYTSSATQALALIEMADHARYETRYGALVVKKNSIFALEESPNELRVKCFSGPGDVRMECGERTITLAPGEELMISSAPIGARAMSDAVGRRNLRTVELGTNLHGQLAEFSILSYLQNTQYISQLDRNGKTFSKMLKTAAALHSLGRARTPYVNR